MEIRFLSGGIGREEAYICSAVRNIKTRLAVQDFGIICTLEYTDWFFELAEMVSGLRMDILY